MTVETYLFYVAPVALAGLAFAIHALSNGWDNGNARRLQPIRVRRDDRRR